MIVKNEDFELEISIGTDAYFGSKTSGQNFKKWDDLHSDAGDSDDLGNYETWFECNKCMPRNEIQGRASEAQYETNKEAQK